MKVSLNPDDWYPARQSQAGSASESAATFTDRTLAGRVRHLLTEKVGEISKSLQQGVPPTLEAYKQTVGELSGLNMALMTLLMVEREMSGADTAKTKEPELYVA